MSKKLTIDLREIYNANNAQTAEMALEKFKEKWGRKISYNLRYMEAKLAGNHTIFSVSRVHSEGYLIIESVNRQIRKIIKSKGCFRLSHSC